jgi:hypothetical protein
MSQAELLIENPNRPALIKKGRNLEYFTIGYNSLEGLIAVAAGLIAGSIALVGFGFDSLIEVTFRRSIIVATACGTWTRNLANGLKPLV